MVNGENFRTEKPELEYTIPSQATQLKVELSAGELPVYEKKWEIHTLPKIDFSYEDMESPYEDLSMLLKAKPVDDQLTYKWVIEDNLDSKKRELAGQHATFRFSNEGVYDVQLTATSQAGCQLEISKPVAVLRQFDPLAPNAFTPNANRKNETFIPVGFTEREDQFKMEIFNRHGDLIYKTLSTAQPWNGRVNNSGALSPEGTYIWKVTIRNKEGNEAVFTDRFRLLLL